MKLLSIQGRVLYEGDHQDGEEALFKASQLGLGLTELDWSGAYVEYLQAGTDLSSGSFCTATFVKDLESISFNYADLTGAEFSQIALTDCDFTGADVRGAEFASTIFLNTDLRLANLKPIKDDVFAILDTAHNEVRGLRQKLVDGQVEGWIYEGPCACLLGTIANLRRTNYTKLGWTPDGSRPAESWFWNIREGDKPDNNHIAEITLEWLDEYIALHNL